jgi:hypothetical protein
VTTSRIRLLGLALCSLAAALPLDAQLIRVPSPDESKRPVSVSLSAGYFLTQDRFDGQSGVQWQLGDGYQYRAAVDVGLRSGALGLTGTVATIPIRRDGDPSSDGDITLRQFLATFRSPQGSGFSQVIEVSAGLSQWANYSGGDVLSDEEKEPRNALTFVIGYGFGFPVGSRATVTLVQDYATVIGSGEGLPPGAKRSQEQFTTRLGLRYRIRGGN